MGASELDDWATYYAEEPWGAVRDNVHAGMIAATFANAHRGKRSKPFSYSDFMIVGASQREQQQQQAKNALLTVLRLAGKRKRKEAKRG